MCSVELMPVELMLALQWDLLRMGLACDDT